jgi:hypothetical protein
MPSIRDYLSALPHPAVLRSGLISSAILDAIISDALHRHVSYHPNMINGAEMFEYDSGGGDEMKIFFLNSMAMIKGFDHESNVSRHARDDLAVWRGMYDGIPQELDALLNSIEPKPDDLFSSSRDDVTFCTWYSEGQWLCGGTIYQNNDDDGAEGLLSMICLDAEHYEELAADYHGRNFDLPCIEAIYSGTAITEALITKLAPTRSLDAIQNEINTFPAR